MPVANFVTVLSDYARDQSKRASGGIYALAGFNYQLRLYVAELAESLAGNGQALEDAGRVFLEALSDLAVQTRDDLICIQAKRSLTSATLKDAAAEILAIDSFVVQRYPDLHDQVRFQLVASQGDQNLTWNNLPATHSARSTVDMLLRSGRLEQPRIEPDPSWRAITAVWNLLKNPYGFVRFALDRALTRINSAEDAQRIRDDICERFAQDRHSPPLAGQLLVPQDFSPTMSPSASLEIGREITLARVRDQQYMRRSHRRDALYERLLERHDLSHRDLQPAVRVFWLAGRSGVGKSVLLLQAVERLVAEGRRALWLGGAAELLEPALNAIAEAPDDLRPEFIAIDDLYDRDARTRLDLARLGASIDEAGRQAWPLIVTCGPAEFADAFEEDSRYRGFEVHRETLQPIAADEASEIAKWYRQRTGRNPASGPAFAQAHEADGGLFISLAVELAHGDLREFALRFAERVQVNALDTALRLPLALNRLYLRAPYDWLTDTDREKLTTLNVDGDFKLLEPGQAGQVVRLTHPHLGDALYRALRKPGNPQAYANDLVIIFERALREKNAILVLQLLRMFSAPRLGLAAERLAIVDEKRLAEGCARAWQTSLAQCVWDADAAADIATSWACWASMHPAIKACLGGNLFDVAVRSLDGAFKVWPSCWCRLAVCVPLSPDLLAWAVGHLPNENFIVHPNWSFVWEHCLKAAPDSPVWPNMGLDWLQRHLRRPDWHFVWKKLLPSVPDVDWDSEPVLTLGLRRLKAENDGTAWAYVLEDLLGFAKGHYDKGCELAILGYRWLGGREDRAEWAYVWKALLDKAEYLPESAPLAKLLAQGYHWLAGRKDRAEWTYVWRALLDKAEHLPESAPLAKLLAQGYYWLTGREDRAEWTFVWQDLLDKAEQLPESAPLAKLLAQGYHWLAGREDRAEWNYVWQALLEKAEQLPESEPLAELLAQGYHWLAGRKDRAEWTFVWQGLLDKTEHLPESVPLTELLAQGYHWLAGREDRADWTFVWQDLLDKAEQLPESEPLAELLAQGYRWLIGREKCDEWWFVCEILLDRAYKDTVFLDVAARGLARTMNERSWPIIAAKFLALAPEHLAATRFAVELVQRIHACPNSGHWFKIRHQVDGLSRLGDTAKPEIRLFCQTFAERERLPAWALARERMVANAPVQGTVTAVQRNFCSVELAIGLMGWWPINQDCIQRAVGVVRDFYIYEVTPRKGIVGVSHVAPEEIDVGIIYEGQVTGQVENGLFVRIGRRSGLLHRSKCANFTNLLTKYPKGSTIRVHVLEKNKKGLVLMCADKETGHTIDVSSIRVGDEFDGVVSNVVDFGLFVDIGGYSGLLHRSKLPHNIDVNLTFAKGQAIRVQVDAVRDDGKVSLAPVAN